MHRSDIRVSRLQAQSTHDSFEALVVKLRTRRGWLNLVALCRPPYSSVYGAAVCQFCEELAELLDELMLMMVNCCCVAT